MKSIYFHFPFCEARCHYCDFYALGSDRTRPDDPFRFEKALEQEISQKLDLISPELETLFMGGGTPSMTPPDSMARALEPLWKKSRITPQTEWTLEANPSSITLDSFRRYRAYGVNRVSMGVQALQPSLLTLLGRVHSREGAIQALEGVFEAGFDNVSVDLLCGVPGQSLNDLEESISIFTRYPITHLSCYLLTLAPHHKMYSQLPNEETQLSHLLFIHEQLVELGFEHYEISNFARPGKESKHNLLYWKGQSYLGLGPSAHSFDSEKSVRWKNVSSLHKYAALLESGQNVKEAEEFLTPEQRDLEKWMLGLRLSEGFPSSWLDSSLRRKRADLLKSKNLLEVHPKFRDKIRLTPKGFALSDQIIRELA